MKFHQLLVLSSCAWLSRAFVLPSSTRSSSVQQGKSVLNLVQRETETYRPYDTAYSWSNNRSGMRSRYSPGYTNGENWSSTNPMRYQAGYYNDRGYDSYYNGRRGYDSYGYNRPYDSQYNNGMYSRRSLKEDITGFPGENTYYRSSRYQPVYSSDARIRDYESSYYGRGGGNYYGSNGRMNDPYYYDNSYNYGDMRYNYNQPRLLADRLKVNGNYGYNSNNNYDSYGYNNYNRRYSPYYSPASYNDGWGVRSYDNYNNGYYGGNNGYYNSGYYGGNGYGSSYYGSGVGGGVGYNRPMLLNDRLKYGGGW
jgi:hypothetical protein